MKYTLMVESLESRLALSGLIPPTVSEVPVQSIVSQPLTVTLVPTNPNATPYDSDAIGGNETSDGTIQGIDPSWVPVLVNPLAPPVPLTPEEPLHDAFSDLFNGNETSFGTIPPVDVFINLPIIPQHTPLPLVAPQPPAPFDDGNDGEIPGL